MKIESPVLRRLGPVPFWRGTKKCLTELDLVYRRATEAASRALAEEPEPSAAFPKSDGGVVCEEMAEK